MKINKYTHALITSIALAAIISATPVLAADYNSSREPSVGMMGNRYMTKLAVIGTVTSVSGNIVTVNGKQGFNKDTASSTFTVDVSNAKIYKDNATTTVLGILVGDRISAQGTVTGNNVVAKIVVDGVRGMGFGNMRMNEGKMPMFDKNINPNDTAGNIQKAKSGFFGKMGAYFARIFGL